MKQLQQLVKEFCKQNEMNYSIETHFIDLISELGEVGKELLKASDYGKKEFVFKEELNEELGDAFYSLITVANSLGIDLETELIKALDKYKRRLKKGSAGSENN